MIARLFALAICLSACIGIGLELSTMMKNGASIFSASWVLMGYFTILTNGLVALVFGVIAIFGERFGRPRLMAGVLSAIVLVGVVFSLLLQGQRPLAGATAVANFLLHQLNPILVAVFWLLFTRKGALTRRDPQNWALYPLGYLAYALVRGLVEQKYPYPFIDVAAIGWTQVIVNSVAIALSFVVAGQLLVWLDHRLARG